MGDTLQFAGQLEITKLVLTSIPAQTSIDISNMFLEMDIYESLFENYISGTITISDSMDLINNLPLVGEETLEVEYITPSMNTGIGLVNNKFYVHKVADRKLTKENTQVYILHFMSAEAFVDLHIKLGRAYKGQFSSIAYKLFSEEDALGASQKAVDNFVVEETSNAFKFIAPGWSPIKCLNWIAGRSISRKYNSANYIFYQDMFKFNFVSIDSLIDAEPYMYYVNKSINIRTLEDNPDSSLNNYNIVRSASNDLVFDIGRSMVNGTYAGKLISYDILSKKVNIQEFDFITSFNKTKHLNPYPLNSSKFLRNPTSFVAYYPMHYYMHSEFDTDSPETWVLQRRALLNRIDSYSAELVVAGRTDVHVGQTIIYEENTISSHDNDDDAKDTSHSGKFLISAIAHRISPKEHEMILTIVKDSNILNLG